VGEL
jgi:hypothetical protein